jgi:hypothetical protein
MRGFPLKEFMDKLKNPLSASGVNVLLAAGRRLLQVSCGCPHNGCIHLIFPRKELSMFYEFIGRILFPRVQRWEQRRKVKLLTVTILVACTGAAFIGLTIYKHNR